MGDGIRTSDFDYTLPADRIAQEPLADRTAAKLLVLDRGSGLSAHRVVHDLVQLLHPGDLLVLNDTRVIRARLYARRPTGGRLELLLLHPVQERPGRWCALVRRASPRVLGERLMLLEPGTAATTGPVVHLESDLGRGEYMVAFEGDPEPEAVLRLLDTYGAIPLPPYIHAPLGDPDRYQTVYAEKAGSVAAPTAGLHFTPDLLDALHAHGVEETRLTLHVGAGTFRPVQVEQVEEHRMHAEWFDLPDTTVEAIRRTRQRGGRVVAVGTTSTRVLESRPASDGVPEPGSGWTDLFIRPGFRFTVVDALLTNFHLPRSTLLMLVAAFAGRDAVLAAYQEALRHQYRFYSLGDAMLII